MLFSPGGGDPAMQLWMTVSRVFVRPFGLALDVSAPLQPRNDQRPGRLGEASRVARPAPTLFVRYEPPDSRLYAIAAAGGR